MSLIPLKYHSNFSKKLETTFVPPNGNSGTFFPKGPWKATAAGVDGNPCQPLGGKFTAFTWLDGWVAGGSGERAGGTTQHTSQPSRWKVKGSRAKARTRSRKNMNIERTHICEERENEREQRER